MSTINNTVSERIFEKLKDNILAGVYQPGNRLLYGQIASEFHVSMTPIREALLKLEQEGLVKTIPRKGTYITELTDQDIIEYTRIRFALEALAVDIICETMVNPEEIRRLELINGALEEAINSRQLVTCMTLDIKLHHTIVEICGNHRLFDLMNQLPLTNFYALRGNQNRMVEMGQEIIKQHAAIITNLYSYNAEAAKNSLRENILSAQLNVIILKQ
jgi:DNA-binding GntR family transcriptional regulator